MTYRVDFTSAVSRQIRKLPKPARIRVLDAAAVLQNDPRLPGARNLVGEDTAWRIRVGEYRLIYDIIDRALTVTVVRVGHRRDVYDR